MRARRSSPQDTQASGTTARRSMLLEYPAVEERGPGAGGLRAQVLTATPLRGLTEPECADLLRQIAQQADARVGEVRVFGMQAQRRAPILLIWTFLAARYFIPGTGVRAKLQLQRSKPR